MKELGPNEGMNALRHPDCRFCAEYERLVRGRDAEIATLKKKLAKIEQGGDADGGNRLRPSGTSPAHVAGGRGGCDAAVPVPKGREALDRTQLTASQDIGWEQMAREGGIADG